MHRDLDVILIYTVYVFVNALILTHSPIYMTGECHGNVAYIYVCLVDLGETCSISK